MTHLSHGEGRLEVICGPMFSGKTEELLRRVRRAQIAKQPTVVFKPATDTRWDAHAVRSHDANESPSVMVRSSAEIGAWMAGQPRHIPVVAIDEAQFFDNELPRLCAKLADEGHRVIPQAWTSTLPVNLLAACRSCLPAPRRCPSSTRCVSKRAGQRIFLTALPGEQRRWRSVKKTGTSHSPGKHLSRRARRKRFGKKTPDRR